MARASLMGGGTGGQKPAAGEEGKNATKSSEELPTAKEIGAKLIAVIKEDRKSLKNLYGTTDQELDENLKDPIKKGVEMAGKLITEKGCSYEIAIDLTALTLYNVAVLIDDSGSMISEENGERKNTLIQYVDSITEICSMANDCGIAAMRFMNSKKGKRNWRADSSQGYLDEHLYGGVTRIGTELQSKILDVLAPKAPSQKNPEQKRPLLVLTVTDGAVCFLLKFLKLYNNSLKKQVEGERKGHLKSIIRDCVNERQEAGKGFEAVTFQFSRIGNDPGATQLLEELDNDVDLGKYIDILPVECDLRRQLAEDRWFVLPKILLGAILPDVKSPHPKSLDQQSANNRAQWDGQDYYQIASEKIRDHIAEMKVDGNVESDEDWDE
ncbi:unnamed protein product [Tuber aestivum]|uniref:VWFA domain-containing protein n=1 Tax=Tuber aestivum TaxID=59557 RepID=A0A292Q2E4_9PEZI|nr:unnamed protein product [Tuber aestivum]